MAGGYLGFRSAWRQFFSTGAIVPLLVGSLALGIASNAAYAAITGLWAKMTLGRNVFLLLASLAILILAVYLFGRLMRTKPTPLDPSLKRAGKHKGLIFLVSREEPARKAVQFHRPVLKKVWLICSPQSLGKAQGLQYEFLEDGIEVVGPIVINNINDPLDVRREVDRIYTLLPRGWTESDVISDYLGMTAHASVGMVLACINTLRPLEYTVPIFDETGENVIGIADEPMEVVLN